MKSLILAGALVLAAANLTPAFALGPRASDSSFPPQANITVRVARAPHFEWQYGYVGEHARYAPHWVTDALTPFAGVARLDAAPRGRHRAFQGAATPHCPAAPDSPSA